MPHIFQHIIIGINEIGNLVLQDTSRVYHYHNFDLPDKISVKIHISCRKGEEIKITARGGKMEVHRSSQEIPTPPFDGNSLPPFPPQAGGIFQQEETTPVTFPPQEGGILQQEQTTSVTSPPQVVSIPSGSEGEAKLENRRQLAVEFYEKYRILEEACRSEWERVSHPDLLRDIANAGFQVRGKKVFIVADLSDARSSAIVIPLLAALKYLFRNESIPDIHWNVIGILRINDTPPAKLSSYAFLRELSFLKSTHNPVKIFLKTPPIDTEIDLARQECSLHLLDARAKGVAPLPLAHLSEMTSRYIFFSSFYELSPLSPQDDELYFHTFGAAECLLSLRDLQSCVALRQFSIMSWNYRDQVRMDRKGMDEIIDPILKKIKRKEEEEDGQDSLPDLRRFRWKPAQLNIEDFPTPEGKIKDLRDYFQKYQAEIEKDVAEVTKTHGIDQPFYVRLSDTIDKLMKESFYGFLAARKLIEDSVAKIKKSDELLVPLKTDTPSEELYKQLQRELQESISADMPFLMILFASIFIMIPFSLFFYEYIIWKDPYGDIIFYIIMIFIITLIIALGGSWIQKTLMSESLREKFQNYADCIESFHKSKFYESFKKTMEKFYLELLHLIDGIDESSREKINPEVLKVKPLRIKIEEYMKIINETIYEPELCLVKFYGSPYVLDPSSEKDVETFVRDFLGEEYRMDDPEFCYRQQVIFEKVRDNLPLWNEVIQDPRMAHKFFATLHKNLLKRFLIIADEKHINMWTIIEKMGKNFEPIASRLLDISCPLINFQDNRLLNEVQSKVDEKIIFLSEGGQNLEPVKDLADRGQFRIQVVDFLKDSLMLFHTCRHMQIYKLAYLGDWKYFEDQMQPEDRKLLYFNDEAWQSSHIDYESRSSKGGQL